MARLEKVPDDFSEPRRLPLPNRYGPHMIVSALGRGADVTDDDDDQAGVIPAEVAAVPDGPLCEICGFSLKPQAIFCTKCKKFQGSRRRFWAGVSFAAIVSAVPVVTLAVTVLNTQVFHRYADVRASLVHCESGGAVVALSNVGTRSGVLRGGTVEQVTGGAISQSRGLLPPGADRAVALKPDESQVVRLKFISKDDGVESRLPPGGSACIYRIRLDVTGFDQKAHDVSTMECQCEG